MGNTGKSLWHCLDCTKEFYDWAMQDRGDKHIHCKFCGSVRLFLSAMGSKRRAIKRGLAESNMFSSSRTYRRKGGPIDRWRARS
jgi:DNA-directed RNA polymerase subunit RPC12/RpoP